MRRKKRKSGIGKKIRVALLAAILFAAIGLYANYWFGQPLSAVMFAVCGKPQGVLVTLRDGTQVFYPPTAPDIGEVVRKIPDRQKGTLYSAAVNCQPPKQKVY